MCSPIRTEISKKRSLPDDKIQSRWQYRLPSDAQEHNRGDLHDHLFRIKLNGPEPHHRPVLPFSRQAQPVLNCHTRRVPNRLWTLTGVTLDPEIRRTAAPNTLGTNRQGPRDNYPLGAWRTGGANLDLELPRRDRQLLLRTDEPQFLQHRRTETQTGVLSRGATARRILESWQ